MKILPFKYCYLLRSFNPSVNAKSIKIPYLSPAIIFAGERSHRVDPLPRIEYRFSQSARSRVESDTLLVTCFGYTCESFSDTNTGRHHSRSCPVIRPLLSSSRSVITAICQFVKIPVYPDRSNQSVQYARNRIRKQILPSIQIFLNPQAEDAIFEFAQLVSQEQNVASPAKD